MTLTPTPRTLYTTTTPITVALFWKQFSGGKKEHTTTRTMRRTRTRRRLWSISFMMWWLLMCGTVVAGSAAAAAATDPSSTLKATSGDDGGDENEPSVSSRSRRSSTKPLCVPSSLHVPDAAVAKRSSTVAAAAAAAAATGTSTSTTTTTRPAAYLRSMPQLIIGHRGASFHLPEHTLAAYRLALELGADYIEPDLVATADGVLVALHTSDLNVTTNVVELFGEDRDPWYSPTAQREGYWAFNFTLAELKRLRVRQRLPAARSTAYDGLFEIPTFTEIVNLLREWNHHTLPTILYGNAFSTDDDENNNNNDDNMGSNDGDEEEETGSTGSANSSSNNTNYVHRRPTLLELQQSGLYVELKDSAWLKEDAGIDTVQLLMDALQEPPPPHDQHDDHFFTNNNGGTTILEELLPCYSEQRFDQYRVPGLVVQAFDISALKAFDALWNTLYSTGTTPTTTTTNNNNNNNNTASNALPLLLLPKVPLIWLVHEELCHAPDFWFKVGDDFRHFISGIGCDKACILHEPGGMMFVEKAREFEMVLHPWTERPEADFIFHPDDPKKEESTTPALAATPTTIMQELMYLFCIAKVQGIFTESVNIAVTAAKMGCGQDDEEEEEASESNAHANLDGTACIETGSSSSSSSSFGSNAMVAIATFVLGSILTTVILFCVGRRRKQRYRNVQPVADSEDQDLDLELT